MEHTDSHGTSNHLISFDSFKKLHAKLDELNSADNFSFESIDKYVTIITMDEGEMITTELGNDSATIIWNICMELINKQQQ